MSNPNEINFIMLVGLSGSGKSFRANELKDTFYKNCKCEICSSDTVRYQLYGNENIQGDSTEVFKVLHNKVINNLKNDISVIYDATNLTLKNRKSILDEVNSLKKKLDKFIRIYCEIISTPFTECLKRNLSRDRFVPEQVIYNMLSRFQVPLLREGFDSVTVVSNHECPLKHYSTMFDEMVDFNQYNPHHKFNLQDHCNMATSYINENCCEEHFEQLNIAAMLHDYGKLFTRTFDSNGIAHYYGHENVGAYKVLTECNALPKVLIDIVRYINYHMLPFQFANMSNKKKAYYMNLFGLEMWNNLLLLHEADINS